MTEVGLPNLGRFPTLASCPSRLSSSLESSALACTLPVLYSDSAYTYVANLSKIDDEKTKSDYFRTVFLILHPKYQINFYNDLMS